MLACLRNPRFGNPRLGTKGVGGGGGRAGAGRFRPPHASRRPRDRDTNSAAPTPGSEHGAARAATGSDDPAADSDPGHGGIEAAAAWLRLDDSEGAVGEVQGALAAIPAFSGSLLHPGRRALRGPGGALQHPGRAGPGPPSSKEV